MEFNMPSADMVVDPNSDAFSDLWGDDIKVFSLEGGRVNESKVGKNVRATPDDMDDYDESDDMGFDDFDSIDDGEVNELEGLEDNSIDEAADYTNPSEYFSTLNDDAVIDFGGKQLTKAQIKELAASSEDMSNKAEAINQYVQNFSEVDRKLDAQFSAALTETEEMYNSITRKINDPRTTHSEKGQLYDDLQRVQNRYQRINDSVAQAEHARRERDSIDLQRRHNEVNVQLSKELGSQWNPDFAKGVIDYALKSGVTGDQISKNLSPSFFKMMIKAKRFDEAEGKRTAKLNETMTKAPRSKRSGNAPRGNATPQGTKVRKAYLDKLNSGDMSESDMSNMFSVLED